MGAQWQGESLVWRRCSHRTVGIRRGRRLGVRTPFEQKQVNLNSHLNVLTSSSLICSLPASIHYFRSDSSVCVTLERSSSLVCLYWASSANILSNSSSEMLPSCRASDTFMCMLFSLSAAHRSFSVCFIAFLLKRRTVRSHTV